MRRLCASSGCQGELAAGGERGAPNSAEGGEESLRCTCLPEGGAPCRHASGEHQFTIEQAVVQLSGKNKSISNKLVDVNSSQLRSSRVVAILGSFCAVQSTQLLFSGILHVILLCVFTEGIIKRTHSVSKSRYSV